MKIMGLFGAKKETDPVCHMSVDAQTAKWKSDHEGKTYYFCGPGCKQKFDANPYKFLGSSTPHSM